MNATPENPPPITTQIPACRPGERALGRAESWLQQVEAPDCDLDGKRFLGLAAVSALQRARRHMPEDGRVEALRARLDAAMEPVLASLMESERLSQTIIAGVQKVIHAPRPRRSPEVGAEL